MKYCYTIKIKGTSKYYVGSSENPRKRFSDHLNLVKTGRHWIPEFQGLGEDDIIFEVVSSGPDGEVLEAEEMTKILEKGGEILNKNVMKICPECGGVIRRKYCRRCFPRTPEGNKALRDAEEPGFVVALWKDGQGEKYKIWVSECPTATRTWLKYFWRKGRMDVGKQFLQEVEGKEVGWFACTLNNIMDVLGDAEPWDARSEEVLSRVMKNLER